jgi:hypothetical protein
VSLVKYNNNSISDITTTALATGSLVPIKTLTASSSATLSFVHGTDGVVLDSTYPIYKFEFINIHPASNTVNFTFNMSTDSGSNYNVTKTSTFVYNLHHESNGATAIAYNPAADLAQSTGFQRLNDYLSNADKAHVSGTLQLFNPSSTTFVKHWISRQQSYRADLYCENTFVAGYGNTTSAINAVRFQMSSGNIDSGKIKLYGIKDS